ncbi:hypothetical protein LINPERHAP1_LOCUS22350 [Linum perenne]
MLSTRASVTLFIH